MVDFIKILGAWCSTRNSEWYGCLAQKNKQAYYKKAMALHLFVILMLCRFVFKRRPDLTSILLIFIINKLSIKLLIAPAKKVMTT